MNKTRTLYVKDIELWKLSALYANAIGISLSALVESALREAIKPENADTKAIVRAALEKALKDLDT